MGDAVGDEVLPPSREAAAAFLRTLGLDVEATRAGAGEGLDLRGADVVVVVGDRETVVGLAQLQRLSGVAAVEHVRAAAVAVRPYPPDAAAWAARADVALFTLTADGSVEAANDAARRWSVRPGEPELRRRAVDGDPTAMTALARLLLRDRRRTEATLWYRRAGGAAGHDARPEGGAPLPPPPPPPPPWSSC